MLAAWIGVCGVLAGAVITGVAAWVLQRHRDAVEARAKVVAERQAALLILGSVRVSASELIDFLERVAEDAADGRFLDLSEFDERSTPLALHFRDRLVSVSHPGAEHLFYSRLATTLALMHHDLRRAIRAQSSDAAREILTRTASFDDLRHLRRTVTTEWINDVLNGRWINPSP